MTDDRRSAVEEGFSDPDMLRTFFEEQDDEIANAHGLARNALDAADALRVALTSLINVLAAQAPAIRSIMCADLDEAAERERQMRETTGQEYDIESCFFLSLSERLKYGRL